MDCLEARRKAATETEAANHVATCRMCNAVVAHPDVESALRAVALSLAHAGAADPGPQAWSDLQTRLAAERGPRAWLRSLPRNWVAAAGLIVGLAVVMMVDSVSRGPHWDQWPLWHQLATLVGGSVLLGGGLAIGMRSVFSAPTKAVLWATGLLAVAAGVLMAFTPETLGEAPDTTPFVWTRPFAEQAWGCMRYGMLCTVPLLTWLGVSHRWQPRRPARTFAAAAAVALVGMLALEVHCPALSLPHRLVAHASLGLIFGSIALVVSIFR